MATFSLWWSPTETSPERNHHCINKNVKPSQVFMHVGVVHDNRNGRPAHWWLVNNVTGEKLEGMDALETFKNRGKGKGSKSKTPRRSSSPANTENPTKPKDCVGIEDIITADAITKETAVIIDKQCYDVNGLYDHVFVHKKNFVPHNRRELTKEEKEMIYAKWNAPKPFREEYALASIRGKNRFLYLIFKSANADLPSLDMFFEELNTQHTATKYNYEYSNSRLHLTKVADDNMDVYAADFKLSIPREESVRLK